MKKLIFIFACATTFIANAQPQVTTNTITLSKDDLQAIMQARAFRANPANRLSLAARKCTDTNAMIQAAIILENAPKHTNSPINRHNIIK